MSGSVNVLDFEIVSPLSIGLGGLSEAILSNVCAEDDVIAWPKEAIPFHTAAQVKNDLRALYKGESSAVQELCKYDRKFELLVSCAVLAKNRIQNLIDLFPAERTGTIVGVGVNVIPFELFNEELFRFQNEGLNPVLTLLKHIRSKGQILNPLNTPYDIHAIHLAGVFNAAAYQRSVVTACVSSTQAIALAMESIRNGEVDVVVVAGTDSIINALGLTSFGKLGVISESSKNPSCTPFDLNRHGTLAGEAAGIVILASDEFTQSNRLMPMAEIIGYGNNLDGYNITAPDPAGTSMTQAIKDALEQAEIQVKDLDYINAHGTGTIQNDEIELASYLNALGNEVFDIPISSTKSRHGHAIAAAGIQELCLLLQCMKDKIIPANINLKQPCDERFNLPKQNLEQKINYALTSNFAFGGVNTVLSVKNHML